MIWNFDEDIGGTFAQAKLAMDLPQDIDILGKIESGNEEP